MFAETAGPLPGWYGKEPSMEPLCCRIVSQCEPDPFTSILPIPVPQLESCRSRLLVCPATTSAENDGELAERQGLSFTDLLTFQVTGTVMDAPAPVVKVTT